MTSHDVEIQQFLISNEARAISSEIEKAIWLWKEKKLAKKRVARYFDMDVSKLKRAIKSVEQHREIGQNGRPTTLKVDEELELVKEIRDKSHAKDPLIIPELISMVFLTLLFLFISHQFVSTFF